MRLLGSTFLSLHLLLVERGLIVVRPGMVPMDAFHGAGRSYVLERLSLSFLEYQLLHTFGMATKHTPTRQLFR